MKTLILSALCFCFTAASAQDLTSADQVIDKYLEVTKIKANAANITDLVMNMIGGKLLFPDNLDMEIPKVYNGACIALVFPKNN